MTVILVVAQNVIAAIQQLVRPVIAVKNAVNVAKRYSIYNVLTPIIHHLLKVAP